MAVPPVIQQVQRLRGMGFTPFPLRPATKLPYGGSLHQADKSWFHADDNIGLFTGSPNGLVVADADSPESQAYLTKQLQRTGWYSFLTIVRTPSRSGLHFWLKIPERPAWAQAYYKLPKHVGSGEFRCNKPAYVVAPGSTLPMGSYEFVQGSLEYFVNEQPVAEWVSFAWMLPPHALVPRAKRSERAVQDLPTFAYVAEPGVLRLFDVLRDAQPGQPITKVDFRSGDSLPSQYGSRSEAETGLVIGLVLAGWSWEQIAERFAQENPGHYAARRDPEVYLERVYDYVLGLVLEKA